MVLLIPVILCKIVVTYPHFVHSVIHKLIHRQTCFPLPMQEKGNGEISRFCRQHATLHALCFSGTTTADCTDSPHKKTERRSF